MDENNLFDDELSQSELYQLIQSMQSTSTNDTNLKSIKNDLTESDTNNVIINSPNTFDKNTNIEIDNDNKKNKPNRCQFSDCKRKIKLIDDYVCKCGLRTCKHHRFFTEHNCTFNYKNEFANKLEKLNPKIVGKKMETID